VDSSFFSAPKGHGGNESLEKDSPAKIRSLTLPIPLKTFKIETSLEESQTFGEAFFSKASTPLSLPFKRPLKNRLERFETH